MSTRLASTTALVVAVLACFTMAAAAQQVRILPNSANIPLLDGSSLHNPCDIANWPATEATLPAFEPPMAQCVLAPSSRALEFQNAYVRELRLAGWDFEGGAGNVFFFERSADRPGCRQALDMTGFPRDMNYGAAGLVLIFALRPEPVCRNNTQ